MQIKKMVVNNRRKALWNRIHLELCCHITVQKYGFSMEALASGICSTTTLSRVEAGSREIDSLMAEALLGRVEKVNRVPTVAK